jgi:hypothetical protein
MSSTNLFCTLLLLTVGCKTVSEKENQAQSSNLSTNMATTIVDTTAKNQFADHREILKASLVLDKKGFKRPDYPTFRAKVLEIFGIDLDTTSYNDVRLMPPYKMGKDETIPYCPMAIKNARYIDADESYLQNSVELDTTDKSAVKMETSMENYLYCFNQMLFYNDKAALARVQGINDMDGQQESFESLLYDYAYTGNDDINKVLIGRISETREGYDSFVAAVYSAMRTKRGFGVRKNVLDKMLQFKPGLMIHVGELLRDIKVDYTSAPNQTERLACLQDIALLLDASIQAAIPGFAEEMYDTNKEWKEEFKKNKYFQLPALRQFSEQGYRNAEQRKDDEQENVEQVWLVQERAYQDINKSKTGVINDPDGYTNIRQYGRSTNSEILGKLMNGEKFYYWQTTTDWWIVQTKSGLRGFVHKSRIRESSK